MKIALHNMLSSLHYRFFTKNTKNLLIYLSVLLLAIMA